MTESLQYGHSSLGNHLLVLTNLIVRDAQVTHFWVVLYQKYPNVVGYSVKREGLESNCQGFGT
ncbi:MAG: hypothetical protein ACFE9L_07065 [Candidatus Hodarchaeota archaeon]